MMHLRFSLIDAFIEHKEDAHPQEVMRALGITYQHSTPQSMGNQWWFWNCEGNTVDMPSYLTPLNIDDPKRLIGFGLNADQAEMIKNYTGEKL